MGEVRVVGIRVEQPQNQPVPCCGNPTATRSADLDRDSPRPRHRTRTAGCRAGPAADPRPHPRSDCRPGHSLKEVRIVDLQEGTFTRIWSSTRTSRCPRGPPDSVAHRVADGCTDRRRGAVLAEAGLLIPTSPDEEASATVREDEVEKFKISTPSRPTTSRQPDLQGWGHRRECYGTVSTGHPAFDTPGTVGQSRKSGDTGKRKLGPAFPATRRSGDALNTRREESGVTRAATAGAAGPGDRPDSGARHRAGPVQPGLFPTIPFPDELIGYRGPSVPDRGYHLSPARLLGPHLAGRSVDPRRGWLGQPAAVPFKDILVLKIVAAPRYRHLAAQHPRAVDHLRRRGVEDLANITLFSDGTTVYECTSAEEVVDLLQGGQGVHRGVRRDARTDRRHRRLPVSARDGGESIAAPEDELASRRASGPQDRLIHHRRYLPRRKAPIRRGSIPLRVSAASGGPGKLNGASPARGEFRRRQSRTPKEQHLPSTSQAPDRARPRCLWKAVDPSPGAARPWKGPAGPQPARPESSGARFRVDDRGRVVPACPVEESRARAAELRRPAHRPSTPPTSRPMLDVIGVASLDDLAAKAPPAGILDALDDSGRAPGMAPSCRPGVRTRGAGRAAGAGRLEHRGRVDDRPGLLRHADRR